MMSSHHVVYVSQSVGMSGWSCCDNEAGKVPTVDTKDRVMSLKQPRQQYNHETYMGTAWSSREILPWCPRTFQADECSDSTGNWGGRCRIS